MQLIVFVNMNVYDFNFRTIQPGMELEASKKMVENMVSKLRQNTALTGQERKVLIEALETHSTA